MSLDNILLVADPYQESLYQINLANGSVWKLPGNKEQFTHVAYDPVEEKLYVKAAWTITRANLDGTSEARVAGYCFRSIVNVCLMVYLDVIRMWTSR